MKNISFKYNTIKKNYFHFLAKFQKVGGTTVTVTLTVTVKTFSLKISLKMKWHTPDIYRRP